MFNREHMLDVQAEGDGIQCLLLKIFCIMMMGSPHYRSIYGAFHVKTLNITTWIKFSAPLFWLCTCQAKTGVSEVELTPGLFGLDVGRVCIFGESACLGRCGRYSKPLVGNLAIHLLTSKPWCSSPTV